MENIDKPSWTELSAAKTLNSDPEKFSVLKNAIDFVKDSEDGIIYITPGDYYYEGRPYMFNNPIEIFADEIKGSSIEEVFRLYKQKIIHKILRANPSLRPKQQS